MSWTWTILSEPPALRHLPDGAVQMHYRGHSAAAAGHADLVQHRIRQAWWNAYREGWLLDAAASGAVNPGFDLCRYVVAHCGTMVRASGAAAQVGFVLIFATKSTRHRWRVPSWACFRLSI